MQLQNLYKFFRQTKFAKSAKFCRFKKFPSIVSPFL